MRTLPATAALIAALALAAPASSAPDGPETLPPRPEAAETAYDRAAALVAGGRYAEAIPILEEVVAEEPANADAMNYLGFAHRKLKNYALAKSWYEKALAADPGHRRAHEYLGEWHLETGDRDGALRQRERLAALCPDGCAELDALDAAIDGAPTGY